MMGDTRNSIGSLLKHTTTLTKLHLYNDNNLEQPILEHNTTLTQLSISMYHICLKTISYKKENN